MKRKVYRVQSDHGHDAVRYSFNAAMNDAAAKMVREHASAHNLRGTWTLAESLRQTAPGDPYLSVHGCRVWCHDATGALFTVICTLEN